MPRGPRLIYKNAIVNIVSRGNNKRIIFKKDKDFKYFKMLLLKYKKRYGFKLYHYCLMRNHVHLLLEVIEPAALAKTMQGVQLSYYHYFRKRYGYVGRFWQGRFCSKLIKNSNYLLTAGLYIERNPLKAGLVNHPSEYKWSSYNIYAHGVKDSLIDLSPYYNSLSHNGMERCKIYRDIMEAYLKVENNSLYLIDN
jgi:putative transposase